jgi:hypothetical protein
MNLETVKKFSFEPHMLSSINFFKSENRFDRIDWNNSGEMSLKIE